VEIAIREIPNSSGPSIGKDAWRAINLSLTRDLKWSKGEFVRIHETRIHDWITTVDLREIWTVNCPGRNRHFGNREDEGGKSFDLVTHEIPIREMPMRSESSDHGESGPLDQVDESSEGGYQVIGQKSLRSRVGRSEFSVENSRNREDRKIARSCKVVSGWRNSPP
jgi:hypothetical protein